MSQRAIIPRHLPTSTCLRKCKKYIFIKRAEERRKVAQEEINNLFMFVQKCFLCVLSIKNNKSEFMSS